MREGLFGDLRLDPLNFSVYVKWPGAIHESNGEALILIDERADERQREAIMTLVKGKVGGAVGHSPLDVADNTWP